MQFTPCLFLGRYAYLYPLNMRSSNYKRRQLVTALTLLIIIVLLICFRQKPDWVERFYFGGLYPVICYLLRPLFNLAPFSLGDIIYLFVIACLLAGSFKALWYLFKARFNLLGRLAFRFLIALEISWLVFYLCWGLNYYRPPAAQLLGLADTSYTISDVARVTALIIDSANNCRKGLSSIDLTQGRPGFYAPAQSAVKGLAIISPKFKTVSPRVKPSLLSWLLNYMGTSGYYNPFTTEAQINNLMPVFDKPFVACHEMAHQTGWAREDEADFAGYLAGINSGDRLLRYSAYYAGIEEFMGYLRRRDTLAHKNLRLKISPLVMQDFRTDSAYWAKYQGGAQMVSGVFFDKFLKANNQPHGLHTYNRMILLTMAWYRRTRHTW